MWSQSHRNVSWTWTKGCNYAKLWLYILQPTVKCFNFLGEKDGNSPPWISLPLIYSISILGPPLLPIDYSFVCLMTKILTFSHVACNCRALSVWNFPFFATTTKCAKMSKMTWKCWGLFLCGVHGYKPIVPP